MDAVNDSEEIAPPLTAEAKAELKRRIAEWNHRREILSARIVTDDKKLNGSPHIRGTAHAIAAIRNAWAERGTTVRNMLDRFKGLSEDDLEAALFHWRDPSAQTDPALRAFVAEWVGPPRRKLYISELSSTGKPDRVWRLDVSEFDGDVELPLADVVEVRFADILRYPSGYAPAEITWHDRTTGVLVDLALLKMD